MGKLCFFCDFGQSKTEGDNVIQYAPADKYYISCGCCRQTYYNHYGLLDAYAPDLGYTQINQLK